MLRKAGAREVHMRVTSPPITHPCFYGIDMGTRWELIAARKTVDEICGHIGADSLGYLSREGLMRRGRPAARQALHGLLHRRVPHGPCRCRWTS